MSLDLDKELDSLRLAAELLAPAMSPKWLAESRNHTAIVEYLDRAHDAMVSYHQRFSDGRHAVLPPDILLAIRSINRIVKVVWSHHDKSKNKDWSIWANIDDPEPALGHNERLAFALRPETGSPSLLKRKELMKRSREDRVETYYLSQMESRMEIESRSTSTSATCVPLSSPRRTDSLIPPPSSKIMSICGLQEQEKVLWNEVSSTYKISTDPKGAAGDDTTIPAHEKSDRVHDKPQKTLDMRKLEVKPGYKQDDSSTKHTERVPIDLVGSPFAVIESDPGVFTNLIHRLGIRKIKVAEIYDLDNNFNPWGLIFCFRWTKDEHQQAEFEDPAAEKVWFANQLSDDACASLAVLNVILNCKDLDIGPQLRQFKEDTEKMSPILKGLAISNSTHIRKAHNALARPSDIFGSRNVRANIISGILEAKKEATSSKRRRKKSSEAPSSDEQEEDAYHFIGYLPAHGKVWELDGLKCGPLEVGELPPSTPGASERDRICGWLEVARPAIRMKMRKYGSDTESGDIRFNLMAIVDDQYSNSTDALEILKREKVALERRLNECHPEWQQEVETRLIESSEHTFCTRARSSAFGNTFAPDSGKTTMDRAVQIMNMRITQELISAWENCIRSAISVKAEIEEMLSQDIQENTEHIKRTHDYEPFIREYISELFKMDILQGICKTSK